MARKPDDAPKAAPAAPRAQTTAAQVLTYLRAHPDFFIQNPEILLAMTAPMRWRGDTVVDMQRFVIERQRDAIDEVKRCTEHLITTTRSNMSTQTRTHEAVLGMLAADGIERLAEVVNDDLPSLLDVDVTTLCFETGDSAIAELSAIGIQRLPSGAVNLLLGDEGRDTALHASTAGDPDVFGGGAGLVRSFALVRLAPCDGCPPGLLALGSRHERTFYSGQGTELLTFLARVLDYGVRRWVGSPR